MTTREQLAPAVGRAIKEIRLQFAGHVVDVVPDGDGGAFVCVHEVDLGEIYEPALNWIGCRITFQYPQADVYPHFLPAGLRREDGRPLGEGFHLNHTWQPPGRDAAPAVMVSRRSNRLNVLTDTAALKLLKVIDWIRSR